MGNKTSSNAVAVAKELVNDSVRYLSELDHEYYRERGYINVLAPFSSGTVSVDPGATYASLSSGGSWSSNYNDAMMMIGDEKVGMEGYITSNPARFTFGQGATWGYSSQASVSYTLFKYRYALPSDFKKIGDIQDETMLACLEWIDDINAFEKRRLATYNSSGDLEVACIASNALMVWPYPDNAQVIPIPYERQPNDMSADSDVVDYPDTGGSLVLIKRCIDHHAAIEEGDEPKIDSTEDRMMKQEQRTRSHGARGRDSVITMGPMGEVERIVKVVGEDD